MSQSSQRDSLLSADDNRRMFDCIARHYDWMNGLLSLGLDRLWRRAAVARLAPHSGGRYLDVGCGTGDLAIEVCRQAPGARVVGIDPSAAMRAIAARKAQRAGVADRVTFDDGDATALAFEKSAFDGVISAFCLRNIADQAKAFAEMRRTLTPGGRAVILELTRPQGWLVRAGHWLYLRCVVAPAGRLIARGGAYRYLVDSIEHLPAPADIEAAMTQAGLANTQQIPRHGGIVTIFAAHR